MNSLNSILLEGNLTRMPEARTTPKGTPLCTFTVASNRYYKNSGDPQKEVSFFDVEAWSNLAKQCGDELEKGRGVRVVGRLKQDRWVDTDGKHHSHVKVIAEHVDFKPQFVKTVQPEEAGDENIELEESEEELAL